jgi:hypothetical protein
VNTALELELWLRDQARERVKNASSRRSYAQSSENLTDDDRKIAHRLAEQMFGRKLPKTTKESDQKNARLDERIAEKLDEEAAMLTRFADFVRDSSI